MFLIASKNFGKFQSIENSLIETKTIFIYNWLKVLSHGKDR